VSLGHLRINREKKEKEEEKNNSKKRNLEKLIQNNYLIFFFSIAQIKAPVNETKRSEVNLIKE
jgi:hypothetical protein